MKCEHTSPLDHAAVSLAMLPTLCIDEESDMDVHDRGMLYYRLLKNNVEEAQKIVCGKIKTVAEKNTVITRVCVCLLFSASLH